MSDVFERIDTSWHTLLDAVDGVPEPALVAPRAVGDWSVKDILGHVAFWKADTADDAERVAAGGPVDAPGDSEPWQVLNERDAALKAEWPLARVQDDLRQSHARAVAALRRVPAATFDEVLGDFIDHSDEHAAEIRGWRAAAGY